MHRVSLEPNPRDQSTRSHTFGKDPLEISYIQNFIPLVDSFVRDHLVFGEDIPVVAQEILGLLSCQNNMEDILNKIKRIDLMLESNYVGKTIEPCPDVDP